MLKFRLTSNKRSGEVVKVGKKCKRIAIYATQTSRNGDRKRDWGCGRVGVCVTTTQTTALIKLVCTDFLTTALISLLTDHPIDFLYSAAGVRTFPHNAPTHIDTHQRLLFLINTHINHPKYLCDKPIINLHRQVQYSDN